MCTVFRTPYLIRACVTLHTDNKHFLFFLFSEVELLILLTVLKVAVFDVLYPTAANIYIYVCFFSFIFLCIKYVDFPLTRLSAEGGGNLDAKKTPSDADCAAHSAAGRGNGAAKGESNRGVVEVTTSGMTHSCLSSHGRWMCAGCLDRWNQHRWRDDTYYL